MTNIPQRIQDVASPIIHVLKSEADATANPNLPLLNLGQAVPYYRLPFGFIENVISRCSNQDFTTYTADPGLPAVRKTISDHLGEKFGFVQSPEQMIITCGANQAYANAVLALFSPGDEVILLDPCYFNHQMALEMVGVKATHIPWGVKGLSLTQLEGVLTSKTRGITLVNPANPTGTQLSEADIKLIVDFACENDLWILSDETYMEVIFDDSKHTSPWCFKEARSRTILISSFSKSLAIPGFRIGFMVMPEEIIPEVMKIQDTLTICAPHLSQLAVMVGLTELKDFLTPHLLEMHRRTDILQGFVQKYQLEWIRPIGGLFAMVKMGDCNSLELALRLIRELQVLVIPGAAFGESCEGWIRISTGSTPRSVFTEALGRMGAFLEHSK